MSQIAEETIIPKVTHYRGNTMRALMMITVYIFSSSTLIYLVANLF